jgi:predicted amidohydrolase YtcJ
MVMMTGLTVEDLVDEYLNSTNDAPEEDMATNFVRDLNSQGWVTVHKYTNLNTAQVRFIRDQFAMYNTTDTTDADTKE